MSEHELSTVDRINSLLDDILIHILSSVPTKQAFVTSILSKRWIHLWLYVPVLELNEIRSKDLESPYHFVLSSLLRWFCFSRGACSHLNLPSLKTLHLKDIIFDQQCQLMMLLDACPVLEDLQLSNIINLESYTRDYFDDFESSSMLRKLNRADITACNWYFYIYRYYYDFPTFHNLTHLVHNYDWNIVVWVLHHCPKLQNLELYQKLIGNIRMHYWLYPKSVPSCVSLNLTTCTMRDFALAGQQCNHIMLAIFILKNARVLETMTIWSNNKQSEIESRLSPCPRASATCQLSFY
ncbi:F-box/RNI/FBD-like domain protein [Medicago truncatula]|uniref:F-box/RNI/FBD-like domain protein n=1 Tax=Medicago truncatula TaxID=3880 RepID=G7IPH8_MEDTR|nr:F-box/RNI/FBD-like domain protein [Medicago truncatula]